MAFDNSTRHQAGAGGGRDQDSDRGSVGKRTLVDAAYSAAPVQHVAVAAPGALPLAQQDPASVHASAAHGTSGAPGALPHLSTIQKAFGRHDVSGIKAHTDAPAVSDTKAMGAEAFASGDHVAFGGTPSLFTAAHEAAHVVQQRGGVQLAGGVGAAGDPYEQHADQVASLVVQGKSAESLLDQHAGGGGSAGVQRSAGPVQMVRVQRSTTGEFVETDGMSPSEIAGLALEFFQMHNMDQLALIQQAHGVALKSHGHNISNESLEMLSAPVHAHSGGTSKKDKLSVEEASGSGGGPRSSSGGKKFRSIPLRQGLIHGTYDEESNSIDLHVDAKGDGPGLGGRGGARDMLAMAEHCLELMTVRERTGGPIGKFMLHPTGAAIVKSFVELLADALGGTWGKIKAGALQTKRKKFGTPDTAQNPDKLGGSVRPEHFAFLESMRGDDPPVSIVPRMRAKHTTEANLNQNMMETSAEGNAHFATYKSVLNAPEDEEPVGPGLDVSLTSAQLPAVIASLRKRV